MKRRAVSFIMVMPFLCSHHGVREVATEIFDILDCRGVKTGKSVSRNEAHRTGTWHGAFHCLIIYERDGKGYALFQKRSREKKIAPGKFDVSVGGHYTAGEGAPVAGPREIHEEIGLDVAFADLLPVGRRVFVYRFAPGITEYEFQDVFLLPKQILSEKIALQEEEVECLLEMEVDPGIRLFAGEVHSIECSRRKNSGAAERVEVSAAEFVPCLDNYYLKMLLLAQRYFQGERKLLFI